MRDEMTDIIEDLRSVKKLRGANLEKLAPLIAAYRPIPEDRISVPSAAAVLARIRRRPGARSSHALRWALGPALGFAVILVVFFRFFPADIVPLDGTAGFVSGNALLRSNGKSVSLHTGDLVHGGDTVTTGPHSFVEIGFGDGRFIRLRENATLSFPTLTTGEHDTLGFKIDRGSLLVRVEKMDHDDSIQITTPTSVAAVRGTLFGVMVQEDRGVRFEVFEGKVEVARRIDEGALPADEETREIINRYCSDHAVILSATEQTVVAPVPPELTRTMHESNADALLAALPATRTSTFADEKPRLSHDAGEFLARIAATEPEEAGIIDDAAVTNVKEQPVAKAQGSAVKSLASWKTHLGPAYLLAAGKTGLLVAVGSTGTASAGDARAFRWERKLGSPAAAQPLAMGSALFILTEENLLLSLSAETGALLWKKKLVAPQDGTAYLLADQAHLYVVYSAGWVFCVTPGGSVSWEVALKQPTVSAPVLAGDYLCIAWPGGELLGIDRRDGFISMKERFSAEIASIAGNRNGLFLVTVDGTLQRYDFNRDEVLWKQTFSDPLRAEIIFDDHSLYVFGVGGTVWKLNGEGALLWDCVTANEIAIPPSADGEFLYVAGKETLFIIDKAMGSVSWSVVIPEIISDNIEVSGSGIRFVTRQKGLTTLKK